MEEIIEWLITAEARAFSVYNKAAEYFHSDEEFSRFIRQLSNDEKEHHVLILQIYNVIKERSDLPPLIAGLSETTRKELDDCLFKIEKSMEDGTLTQRGLIDDIISIEFCEWNDAFAYIVTKMKSNFSEFKTAAININKHKTSIKRFLSSHDKFKMHLDRIAHFPDIWEEKILIVDDEQVIIDVMKAVLSKEGMIETARNGNMALEKLQETYYALIISDINMPVMDGIEFYKRAAALYPSINKRFLFFSGMVDERTADFFKQNNIPFLLKPSHLKEIRKKIIDILTAIP